MRILPANASASPLRQEMDGFGGTFNRAGAKLLHKLSAGTQRAVLGALFADGDHGGANFQLGKVPIAANDFAVPEWYTYRMLPNQSFSLIHDLDPEAGLVPYIKQAMAAARAGGATGAFKLQATMDYPPWWMLNQSQTLPAQGVNNTLLPQLARYFLDFTQQMAIGTSITFLSMFNEPVESYCNADREQIAALLSQHVGPLFRSTPGAPKVTWGEQFGRVATQVNYTSLTQRPEVLNYTDILFYHGYDCEPWKCVGEGLRNTSCPGLPNAIDAIRQYKDTFPNLKMWMTEVCYAVEFDNYPRNTSVCPALPRGDFEDGTQWGAMIFGDLSAGAAGWIYWNYLLDTTGGPWLTSPEHNNPPDNYQQPLIIIDAASDRFVLTGCYYAMAHFSRLVKPGMRYVDLGRAWNATNVYVAAFATPDRARWVVVAMNDQPFAANVTLNVEDARGAVFELRLQLNAIGFVSVAFDTSSFDPEPTRDVRHHMAVILGCLAALVAVSIPIAAVLLNRYHAKTRHRVPEPERQSSDGYLYS